MASSCKGGGGRDSSRVIRTGHKKQSNTITSPRKNKIKFLDDASENTQNDDDERNNEQEPRASSKKRRGSLETRHGRCISQRNGQGRASDLCMWNEKVAKKSRRNLSRCLMPHGKAAQSHTRPLQTDSNSMNFPATCQIRLCPACRDLECQVDGTKKSVRVNYRHPSTAVSNSMATASDISTNDNNMAPGYPCGSAFQTPMIPPRGSVGDFCSQKLRTMGQNGYSQKQHRPLPTNVEYTPKFYGPPEQVNNTPNTTRRGVRTARFNCTNQMCQFAPDDEEDDLQTCFRPESPNQGFDTATSSRYPLNDEDRHEREEKNIPPLTLPHDGFRKRVPCMRQNPDENVHLFPCGFPKSESPPSPRCGMTSQKQYEVTDSMDSPVIKYSPYSFKDSRNNNPGRDLCSPPATQENRPYKSPFPGQTNNKPFYKQKSPIVGINTQPSSRYQDMLDSDYITDNTWTRYPNSSRSRVAQSIFSGIGLTIRWILLLAAGFVALTFLQRVNNLMQVAIVLYIAALLFSLVVKPAIRRTGNSETRFMFSGR